MHALTLLQGLRYVDTFFPSGGFAYSSGLEAAVQGGAVREARDLERYVADFLRGGAGCREAVAAARAHGAALAGTTPVAREADRELEAMQLCVETRRASRQMGRQVIQVAGSRGSSPRVLRSFLGEVDAGATPGHLAVCLGLTLGASGWDRESTVAASLYHVAVGMASAALKLLPIGQRGAQRVLDAWMPVIAALSQEAAGRPVMASWSPVQDIYAMRHHALTSRLFRS